MDVVADIPTISTCLIPCCRFTGPSRTRPAGLFGSRHYDHYDFLVAVSGPMGDIGMEHQRSSEDAVEPGYFKTVSGHGFGRDILPHEYTHSWDGKFRRRTQDQFIADFQQPMRDDLMWVYEGGTEYFGDVLESRAGLYTHSISACRSWRRARRFTIPCLPARQWRNLQETDNDPILSDRGPKSWPSWQRSEDYYDEGALMWLDADTLIREKTGGRKSLDDFAKAFFSMDDLSYLPLTYTFDDVVKALNGVCPYDWASFLRHATSITWTGEGKPLGATAWQPDARWLQAGLYRYAVRLYPHQRCPPGHIPDLQPGRVDQPRWHDYRRLVGQPGLHAWAGGRQKDYRRQRPRLRRRSLEGHRCVGRPAGQYGQDRSPGPGWRLLPHAQSRISWRVTLSEAGAHRRCAGSAARYLPGQIGLADARAVARSHAVIELKKATMVALL